MEFLCKYVEGREDGKQDRLTIRAVSLSHERFCGSMPGSHRRIVDQRGRILLKTEQHDD